MAERSAEPAPGRDAMKRIGHIIDRITLADLRREAEQTLATRRFRRRSAAEFLRNFDTEGPRLLGLIRSGAWTPGPVQTMDIVERGKKRHIEIPGFLDMIVQRAILFGRTEQHIIRHTWHHAFSSIKGRGPLKAAKHVARLIASGKAKWALYFDVRKYYEHVDLRTARTDLERIIKDRAALDYISRAAAMGTQGLAIGNTVSHIIANLYLTPISRTLAAAKGVTDVVTYMDNVFVFGNSKRALHAARRAAVNLLAARGLTMKPDWQVYRTDLRDTKIGGYRVRAGLPWRIYRHTFRHLLRSARRFDRNPTPANARSLASLRGWITTAGCRSVSKKLAPTWANARKVLRNAH